MHVPASTSSVDDPHVASSQEMHFSTSSQPFLQKFCQYCIHRISLFILEHVYLFIRSPAHLRHCGAFIVTILAGVPGASPTFLHCKLGEDRAGPTQLAFLLYYSQRRRKRISGCQHTTQA